MIFNAECRQPFICLPCTHGKEGWRHLGRAAQQSEASRRWGAIVLWRKDFRPAGATAEGYKRRTGACTPDFAYRTRVRYPVS
jgi:hypothetical protein